MTSRNRIHGPPGSLIPADVARIFTEEAQKAKPGRDPIKVPTVWSYVKESRTKGGRYYTNPMPLPDGYTGQNFQGPWWLAEREQALRDWWNSRSTSAHGRGGPRAGSKRKAK